MSIFAWIILGLVAGFVASKIVNRTGQGVVIDVLLGIGGAMIGGWLFNVFGLRGVSGLNLYSMVVATIGAAVVLVLYHALSRSSDVPAPLIVLFSTTPARSAVEQTLECASGSRVSHVRQRTDAALHRAHDIDKPRNVEAPLNAKKIDDHIQANHLRCSGHIARAVGVHG